MNLRSLFQIRPQRPLMIKLSEFLYVAGLSRNRQYPGNGGGGVKNEQLCSIFSWSLENC